MQVKDTGVRMGDSSGQFKSYTCHDFNKGVCRWPSPCWYHHTCSICASPLHGAFACPNKTHSPNSQQTFDLTPFRGRPSSRYQRGRGPTPYARSFRSRFFAYHYAANHPHTHIILSWFSIPLVLKCAAKNFENWFTNKNLTPKNVFE